MNAIARITPKEARRAVTAGEALLVCAYESEGLCAKMQLEGAISLEPFKGLLPTLGKEAPIIFYCA